MNDNLSVKRLATEALVSWEELKELAVTVDSNLTALELSRNNPIFSNDANRFEAVILGFKITAVKKVVSIEGSIEYMEYSFVHSIKKDDTVLLNLYLDKKGNIWMAPDESKRLGDYNSQALAKMIYEQLIVILATGDLTQPSALN